MKEAEYLGFGLGMSNGKPRVYFFARCPYCGKVNRNPYWFRYNICDKCGKVSEVPTEKVLEMIKIEDRFEDLRVKYNHSLPDIEAELREEFGNLVRVKEAPCLD